MGVVENSRRWLPARYLFSYEPRRPIWFRLLEVSLGGLVPAVLLWAIFFRARRRRAFRMRQNGGIYPATISPAALWREASKSSMDAGAMAMTSESLAASMDGSSASFKAPSGASSSGMPAHPSSHRHSSSPTEDHEGGKGKDEGQLR